MAGSIERDARTARNLGRAFLALVGLTWLLIVFGALVRAHGAGLACPDWPYCFGSLLPRMDFRVLLEWGHRATAGIVTFLFVSASFLAWLRPALRGEVGRLIALAGLLLVAQIVLGGLTVLHLLVYWSVVLHLLTGTAFCVVLLLIARRLLGALEPVRASSPRVRALALAAGTAIAIQIALGGLVSSNYAGLACPEWPACAGGVWFPGFDALVGLNLAHRLGGYVTALCYVGLVIATFRDPLLGSLARIGLSLVLFQILIGSLNVLMRLPVEVTALHSAVATLIVLVTTLLLRATLRGAVRGAIDPGAIPLARPSYADTDRMAGAP
ncbi:MAG: hypothetical protein A2Y95_13135 [Deltaproteobacteria bacterium RBG_13_65_10]|nr:MAG: hypothetical protein A2Y95_13135 [Deltaproteobacteria bacterium RBG_13_65_10]